MEGVLSPLWVAEGGTGSSAPGPSPMGGYRNIPLGTLFPFPWDREELPLCPGGVHPQVELSPNWSSGGAGGALRPPFLPQPGG